ncbi:hypothetical protein ABZY14_40770 [Streptomyces sp. NPDC006617]|uniref:hypothetical protein n=1 Tax=Streptomyces sp. NPDC006617 TaxID=3155354 RepID=UPI0033B6C575
MRSARQYALNLGAEHGWTVHLHHGVHRALGLLLKDLPDGQRVSHSHLRERLASTHLPMRHTAEILAALDLLVEDRQDTSRLWADRRADDLPDGFRADVRGWLLWLLDGDARTQPRALGTLHSYFSSVRPIVEQWATSRAHLREVTREDVVSAVDGLRGSQYTGALTALRSLFATPRSTGASSPTPCEASESDAAHRAQ